MKQKIREYKDKFLGFVDKTYGEIVEQEERACHTITIDKYQEETRKTVQYDKYGATETQQLLYLGCALAGEVGELCNKLKKVHRDGATLDVEDLQYEIGDIYWYLTRIEDMFQMVPSITLEKNLDKLQGRKERGTLGGSGDDR